MDREKEGKREVKDLNIVRMKEAFFSIITSFSKLYENSSHKIQGENFSKK